MDIIQADDRKNLAKVQTGKTSKWPRTERRQMCTRQVAERRQPDLTVVLENVHDSHNVSAVLRSCDAVGVLGIHTIYSEEAIPDRAYARTTSGSAAKWIDVQHHASVADCYAVLRQRGFRIYATALTEAPIDLIDLEMTQPIALVFGNEMRGVSEEAIVQADGALRIPMMGMIESLNISVACAVCLFEAMRQRREAGTYDEPKLGPEALESLVSQWLNR